ncbi:MAG: hypothetical protein QM813_11340 [Verrucomicrobiota bacterium]
MNHPKQQPLMNLAGRKAGLAAVLALALNPTSHAYPLGRVDFSSDAPFATGYAHAMTANTAGGLFTVSGWADLNATTQANLWNWWELLGVDSGVGNGALLDGNESITVQLDKGTGVAMMFFRYGGADGSGAGDLARVSISGFTADPGTGVVPTGGPANRVSNITYASGTLSFDYLDDNGGNDAGQLIFSNPAASAGCNLIVTVAASPNGNGTSAFIALTGLDIQEAFGGPQLHPSQIAENTSSTHATPDGLLTVRGFSDLNATIPANLGRYMDECFGIAGPSTVSGNNSVTLQFASGTALVRLDSRYSGNTLAISGFLSDPGLADPSGGVSASSYTAGTLTITVAGGGNHPFYFANRAASVGQTLKLTSSSGQFGIGGIGYDRVPLVMATDITPNVSPTFVSADGLVTLTAYADTPGTVPVNLNRNGTWFGVSGGNNNESTEGAESINLQFAAGASLTGLGTRYTSGQVVISGFTADPGFADPSGIATGVNYSAGTLSYTFNSAGSPETAVSFTNAAASAGQTLNIHTDGNPGSQLTLTRINYATSGITPITLSITKSGSDVTLTWPTGTLQSSTNAAAFYSDFTGATSPYTIPATNAQRFFRVKVQ